MRYKCNTKTCKDYPYYGGRGILVLEDFNSFECFLEWSLSNGYRSGLTLDRIDNDYHYTPSNCRWVSRKTQSRNTRRNKYFTIDGVTKLQEDWIQDSPIKKDTIISRLRLGWSPKAAFFAPVQKRSL